MKRTGTLAMCRLDNNTVLEKGLYYYQGNDFASELVYSVGRLCEPCLEHIDNNFNPLDAIQKGEFSRRSRRHLLSVASMPPQAGERTITTNWKTEIRKANDLNGQLVSPETRRAATHPKSERQHQSQHGIPDYDTGSPEHSDLHHQPDESKPQVPGRKRRVMSYKL